MVPRLLEQQACVAASHLPSVEREREREREWEWERSIPLHRHAPTTVIFIVGPLYRDRERLLINALLSLNATRALLTAHSSLLATRCSLLAASLRVALPLLHLPWQHRVRRLFDDCLVAPLVLPWSSVLDYRAPLVLISRTILDLLFPFLEKRLYLPPNLGKRIFPLFRYTFETADVSNTSMRVSGELYIMSRHFFFLFFFLFFSFSKTSASLSSLSYSVKRNHRYLCENVRSLNRYLCTMRICLSYEKTSKFDFE